MTQTIIKHFCDLCGKEITEGIDRTRKLSMNDKTLCLPAESHWVQNSSDDGYQRYEKYFIDDICEECLNAITEVVMARQSKIFQFGPTAEEIAKMEKNKKLDNVLDR